MARHYKIDDILDEADRPAYEAMLRQPAVTIDDCLQWLGEHGYQVSRGAVFNHRRDFQEVLQGVRRSAEMGRAYAAVVRESGATETNDALLARLQQLQMEWAFSVENGGELSPDDLERTAKAMNHLAGAMQRNEDLRQRVDQAMKKLEQKVSSRRLITQEDIDAVRKAVFG